MKHKKWFDYKEGYITLISVLVVGAVGIAIALSIILLGVGFSQSSFAIEQSSQAKALANACGEEALQQIRDVSSFTGVGGLAFGQGACSYSVTSQGTLSSIVTARGRVGTIVRKISITVSNVNPPIILKTWQEVAN